MNVSLLNPFNLFYFIPVIGIIAFVYKQLSLKTTLLHRWGYYVTNVQQLNTQYLLVSLCLLFACLVIAASQPTWGREETNIELQGISVYILIDVSQSMLVEDVSPSRMEVAKLIALSLAERLTGHEVGLMLFSSVPSILFPLTTDSRSTSSFILAIEAETGRLAGTNYADALQFAMQSFNPETNASRMIIMISDGESFDSSIEDTVQKLIASGVVVHTIGVGTNEGGMIPQKNSEGIVIGYKQYNGQAVISKFLTEKLDYIAQESGGLFQLSNGNPDVTSIIMDYVDRVESGELGIQQATRPIERFYLFVGVAIGFFSLVGFRS